MAQPAPGLARTSIVTGAARANRVPDAASDPPAPGRGIGAGRILGAGILDALLAARGGAPGRVFCSRSGSTARPRCWRVRRGAAGGRAGRRPAARLGDAARRAQPRPRGRRRHPRLPVGVVVVAAVAAAGQRLFVGKMQSQQLATIAAAGLVAIGALPGALAAIAALPLLRRIARALPRPRALGATGVLLITLAVAAALAFVAALSRADWRVLDLGPLYALASRSCSASATACSGSGRRPAGAARAPAARLGSALSFALAVVTFACLIIGRAPARRVARIRAPPRRVRWGMRLLLGAARRATDGDGDGFSARFGGGDCDDRRGDVYPGAEDRPRQRRRRELRGRRRQGVRRGRRPSARARRRHRPRRTRAPNALQGQPAHRHDRCAAGGSPGRRRLRPPGRALADADARRAGAQGRVFPPRLVAGAQHAASRSRDPDRPLPVGHRVGQAGHELSQPAADQPHLLRDAGRRAGWKPIGIFSHFYFTPDRGISRGFAEWSNEGAGTIAESNKDIASPRIVPKVIERLRQAAARKQRFAMWTHLFEPHSSYMTHKEFPTSLTGRPGPDGEIRLRDRVQRSLAREAARRASRRPGSPTTPRSSSWPTTARRGASTSSTSTARICSTSSCACR